MLNRKESEDDDDSAITEDYMPSSQCSLLTSSQEIEDGNSDISVSRNNNCGDICSLPKKEVESAILVGITSNINGVRKWDKAHFYLFCGSSEAKIARHLETKHAEEKEVSEYLAEKKGCLI